MISGLLAGRYRLLEKLGRGGTGAVYLARDELAGRDLALKLLGRRSLSEGEDRLRDEFRLLSSIDHPRIARAFDFGFAGPGVPYIAREFIAGTPLPSGPPGAEEPGEFLAPVLDLLEALEHVHALGVLHLDIHAGNLIVASDSQRGSVLIDFGLRMRQGSTRTPMPTVLPYDSGRWSWYPPELLAGEASDERTDIFLAGRLLQVRLTGSVTGRPKLPREIPGWGVRRTMDLERAMLKATRASPAERFTSALDFREELLRAVGGKRPRRITEAGSPLVGRKAELELADQLLRKLALGESGVLWFSADRALGKSRLLEEIRVRAQLRGFATISFRHVEDPGPQSSLERTIRAALPGPEASSWLDFLAPSCGGAPLERARRAARAAFGPAGRALVFVLDDVDRAKAPSAELVEALLEEATRERTERHGRAMLFVLASRTPPARAPESTHRYTRPLKSLEQRESEELLQSLLSGLEVAQELIERAATQGRGVPLALRAIARELRERWAVEGRIPTTARLIEVAADSESALESFGGFSQSDRRVLELAEIIGRPFTCEEAALALQIPVASVERSLGRLGRRDLVEGEGKGADRRYRRIHADGPKDSTEEAVAPAAKAIHERLASHLEDALAHGEGLAALRASDHLGRHLLALGRNDTGARRLLAAARGYRREGSYDLAASSLERALEALADPRVNIEIAEELADLHAETGSYSRVPPFLAPLADSLRTSQSTRARVRILRRLGVARHRSSDVRGALETFRELGAIADPSRDVNELIFVDSELAEIHLLTGDTESAEEASERGLERLRTAKRLSRGFRARMEVTLRATLGHIALRRMHLEKAREELESAWASSTRGLTLAERAAIAHNLGVTENQRSDFERARTWFSRAAELLRKTGDQRDVAKIETNLAIIAAKLGDFSGSRHHLDQARDIVLLHDDARLNAFLQYSTGLVALAAGESGRATVALQAAASLAESLGDRSLVAFAHMHLGEAHLLAGHYRGAAVSLERALRGKDSGGPTLERMARARLCVLDAILGRTRKLRASVRELERSPASEASFPEAWNEFFVALSLFLAGEDPTDWLEKAQRSFGTVGTPLGREATAALSIARALARDAESALLREPDRSEVEHRFLCIVRVLLVAVRALAQRDWPSAEDALSAASGAIVGTRFLELDWILEYLRARTALAMGDLGEARRHLHRAIGARDLLAVEAPKGSRQRLLSHARFAGLDRLRSQLETSAMLTVSTPRFETARSFEGLVGRSRPMQELYRQIDTLAKTPSTILIIGETGTGKELVSRALSARSLRRDAPKQVIHGSLLAAELFESELFGHAEGAFTGATSARPGLLETLDGGTLILDDVGELPIGSQAKLLAFLDSGRIRRLGSPTVRTVDVRVLATASKGLEERVESGAFRRDLYFRLGALRLLVPPLRERTEDIPLLVEHFLEKHASRLDRPLPRIDMGGLELLSDHTWPGNVRELEFVVVRILVESGDVHTISRRDLERILGPRSRTSTRAPDSPLLEKSLEERRKDLDRRYLRALFFELSGDMKEVQKRLGIKSTKLYDWFAALGLDVRALRREIRKK